MTSDIGKAIKLVRRAMGWSRSKLGLRTGFGAVRLRHIESGLVCPRWDVVSRIAAALELPVHLLVACGYDHLTQDDVLAMLWMWTHQNEVVL